ncbi:MAG: cytidylate kinase-like family protein, partial [Verrucomicrobia bacterium]|nr:cytidylate kinase-like family protein [Verrucomicrobiota bacterium]
LNSQQYGQAPIKQPVPQPFVTLSREAGAGGISITSDLLQRLRIDDTAATSPWVLFDRELVAKVAEEHDLPMRVAGLLEETRYNHFLHWWDDLSGKYPSWSTLVHQTGETIVHLAQLGNVILVGRGGNLLTRHMPGGVHVRLVGSRARRIAHISDYYNLTATEAEASMTREDGGRAMYLKDHFQVDIDDPHLYDLVINTDHVSYHDVVDAILRRVLQARQAVRQATTSTE